MLVVIEDPVLLHEPRDKVEIALPVLHAIFERLECTGRVHFEIGESPALEDLLNDVGNRRVLEDAAVRDARQKPRPRNNLHLVVREVGAGTALRKAADKPIEVPLAAAVRQQNADCHPLPNDVLELNGIVGGEQIEVELEKLRDPLVTSEALQEQNVFSKRRVERDEAIFLA